MNPNQCHHHDSGDAPDNQERYEVPPVPQNVYPTSNQNRGRGQWIAKTPKANRKWTRTGR